MRPTAIAFLVHCCGWVLASFAVPCPSAFQDVLLGRNFVFFPFQIFLSFFQHSRVARFLFQMKWNYALRLIPWSGLWQGLCDSDTRPLSLVSTSRGRMHQSQIWNFAFMIVLARRPCIAGSAFHALNHVSHDDPAESLEVEALHCHWTWRNWFPKDFSDFRVISGWSWSCSFLALPRKKNCTKCSKQLPLKCFSGEKECLQANGNWMTNDSDFQHLQQKSELSPDAQSFSPKLLEATSQAKWRPPGMDSGIFNKHTVTVFF